MGRVGWERESVTCLAVFNVQCSYECGATRLHGTGCEFTVGRGNWLHFNSLSLFVCYIFTIFFVCLF